MQAKRFLISKRKSKCHGASALVVRSREGGMVSQNCLKCGKSGYISAEDLPDLICEFCGNALVVEKKDGTNYHYVCGKCGRFWKVATYVPDWRESFGHCGLAVDADMIR